MVEVTSLAILGLRKLQMWIQSAIFSEMLRFSPIHPSAETFILEFGTENEKEVVQIPKDKVNWLWQGLLDTDGLLSPEKVNLMGTAGRIRFEYRDRELEKKRMQKHDLGRSRLE
jgi:hypothetical protein